MKSVWDGVWGGGLGNADLLMDLVRWEVLVAVVAKVTR